MYCNKLASVKVMSFGCAMTKCKRDEITMVNAIAEVGTSLLYGRDRNRRAVSSPSL